MINKLVNLNQINSLNIGDVITRLPAGHQPDNYSSAFTDYVTMYKVISINKINGIVELIITGDSTIYYSSSVDDSHLYMKPEEFVNEQVWWD